MDHLKKIAGRLAVIATACAMLTACGGSGTSSNNDSSDTSVYYSHSLAFRNATSSTLFSWGYNGYGQLGDNTTTNRSTPVRVLVGEEKYAGTAGGSNHSLAFMNNSTVRAWGYNAFGQLGLPAATKSTSNLPLKVGGVYGVTAVAAGTNFSLALANYSSVPRRVLSWGRNNTGQLGDNTVADSPSPKRVLTSTGGNLLGDVSKIAAGSDHALALKGDGTLWAWGNNKYGQLGRLPSATPNDRSLIALQVTGVSGTITAIAAGGSTSYALTADGTVWAWGYNGFGQLGVPPTGTGGVLFRETPQPVALSGVTAIAAGLGHVVVIRDGVSTGELWAWGANTFGQIGQGLFPDQQTKANLFFVNPVQVKTDLTGGFLSGVVDLLTVTGNHNVVRKDDSTFWVWGNNVFGQLGNGTLTQSALAIRISGF
jgi:alpha-tubulin suppressor-like RCC1 family protein